MSNIIQSGRDANMSAKCAFRCLHLMWHVSAWKQAVNGYLNWSESSQRTPGDSWEL